ncbi:MULTISPECIES: hypothetical protein [Actinoplanes]|uniref:hypothetical protein n=1 Tax=Actinoplanes TaxID=1865 RepID=UPI0005F2D627|nr:MULTISPECIES: hypothetical protein [Actinoplanes]GLY00929.1 hypothetical protein Acsp01_13080 [Actinoplanes sp. NBRC 101535]
MSCRRYGSKPTIALWMLVAVADVIIIVASTGLLLALFFVLAVAVIAAGAVVAGRALGRREAEPVEVAVRRRA